ncbi:hypothetical protein EEB14_51765 [Rhodococcus sp. WS4]|nr:hypothetical protein EEB14_51765 [Rhodococcus sp. WS4]
MLPVTEPADDGVVESADANVVDRRHRDGLAAAETTPTPVGAPMLGTMTDPSGHGKTGRDGSVSRCGVGTGPTAHREKDASTHYLRCLERSGNSTTWAST